MIDKYIAFFIFASISAMISRYVLWFYLFDIGSHHPKVGVVLTCLPLMFRHKAMQEHSSSLLIQEVRTCTLSDLFILANFENVTFIILLTVF